VITRVIAVANRSRRGLLAGPISAPAPSTRKPHSRRPTYKNSSSLLTRAKTTVIKMILAFMFSRVLSPETKGGPLWEILKSTHTYCRTAYCTILGRITCKLIHTPAPIYGSGIRMVSSPDKTGHLNCSLQDPQIEPFRCYLQASPIASSL